MRPDSRKCCRCSRKRALWRRGRPPGPRRGHTGVLERTGRVQSLVFELERVKPAVSGRPRGYIKWGIPFNQADDRGIAGKGQQIAKTPNAAAIARIHGRQASLTYSRRSNGISGRDRRHAYFQESAAFTADVDHLAQRVGEMAIRLSMQIWLAWTKSFSFSFSIFICHCSREMPGYLPE